MKPKPKRKRSQWPKYFKGVAAVYRTKGVAYCGEIWSPHWNGRSRKWVRLAAGHSLIEKAKLMGLKQITRAEAKRRGAKV